MIRNAAFASNQLQGAGMRLPAGVRHVSEVMPAVLGRYGLSLEERPDTERPAVATGANDFFDVSIGALESAPAS